MALKSYRFFGKSKKKKKKRSRAGDFVTGATGAIIGTAFVSQTANVIRGL